MKQSKFMSMMESIINILVGFGISVAAQAFFLPLIGVSIALHQNLIFAGIMTVISIARSYLLRRVFEALHIRRPLSAFMQAVVAERFRQIEVEGWDVAHDDAHSPGEIAVAGAAYALGVRYRAEGQAVPHMPFCWPWSETWWKTQGDRRDLVRATALLLAEGEKHDRTRRAR